MTNKLLKIDVTVVPGPGAPIIDIEEHYEDRVDHMFGTGVSGRTEFSTLAEAERRASVLRQQAEQRLLAQELSTV